MAEKNYSYKYPHPAVTTDSVVFGYDGKLLHVLLVERGLDPFKGSWALPGGFLKMDETVEQGALRELREETGVSDIFLEQFHAFSEVDRDPRERVITVAFYALVRKSDYRVIGGDDAAQARWFPMEELPPLAFDHHEIISLARRYLQMKLRLEPIAFKLLDEKFSMSELQRLYELINGTTYDRRNFYKKMLSTGFLEETEDKTGNEAVDETAEMYFDMPAPSCILKESAEFKPETSRRGRKPVQFSFNRKAYDEEVKPEKGDRNPFDI